MYKMSKKLLEHFTHPKNVGSIKDADAYYAKVENPICGDMTEMWLKIEDGKIKDVKFKTFGCFATISTASAFTEKIKGLSIEELLWYEKDESEVIERMMKIIKKEIGDLPKKKWHCSPASIEAFLRCIKQYYKRKSDEEKIKEIEELLKNVTYNV